MTRPTTRGLGVAGACLLLLVIGSIWSLPQLIGVATAGLILLLGSALITLGGANVRASVRAPERVTRQDKAWIEVRLFAGRIHRFGLVLAGERGGEFAVSWNPDPVAMIAIPTSRRGIWQLGPWRVLRVDPFALFTRQVGAVEAVDVVIVPRIHAASLAQVPIGLSEMRGTQELGTTTFASLREYVVGDELRHIHWRSSAKTGTLMTRQYVDVTRPRIDFVFVDDTRAYGDDEEFERAVDLTASLISVALLSGLDTGLTSTSGEKARMSRGAMGAALDLLAVVQRVATTTEQRLLHLAKDTTIVITGHHASGWWQHIAAAAVCRPTPLAEVALEALDDGNDGDPRP